MIKEDIEFLKELQHEMLTQDTVCQASPRFWVVVQEIKDYWVDDNADGIFIYSKDYAENVFEGSFEDLVDWLNEIDGVENCKCGGCFIEFTYYGDEYSIFDTIDIDNFLEDYDSDNYEVGEYRNREEIAENTMFLTLRECKEHIESNKHHYKSTAHPYAMTAWRSPQVARLYEILEKTDWKSFEAAEGKNE